MQSYVVIEIICKPVNVTLNPTFLLVCELECKRGNCERWVLRHDTNVSQRKFVNSFDFELRTFPIFQK